MMAHNAILYKNFPLKLELFLLSVRIIQVLKQFLAYGRQDIKSVILYTLHIRPS